ncbi:MAG: patatin-like phospholipase family protein [Candidatus Cloacimonetes bacterium]|nr:patatin-like phospholipase family protein [Candidatus Cloacimonadota bacterium]
MRIKKKPCKLVLGGGAARGLAHIGAIDVLREEYDIRAIVGTSMGAVVGGMYACGFSPREMHRMLDNLSTRDIFSMLDLDWRLKGLMSGRNIIEWLDDVTGKVKIEDLRIGFVAIAYDMRRRRTVIIDRGRLSWAMRASSSMPLILAPFVWNDYELVDGCTEHPIPIEFSGLFDQDLLTIAVNVLPPVPHNPVTLDLGSEANLGSGKRSLVHVALEWTANNQYYLASKALFSADVDLVVNAHVDDLDEADFNEYERFIEVGRLAARRALDEQTPLDKLRESALAYLQKLRELRL